MGPTTCLSISAIPMRIQRGSRLNSRPKSSVPAFDRGDATMDEHDLLSVQMSPDERRRLTEAAALAGLSLDDFIVESAFAGANRVLGSLDAALARSIADAEGDRVRPADEVFSELKARYSGDAPEGTEEN